MQYTRDELIAIQVLCENRATEIMHALKTNQEMIPSIRRHNEQYVDYLKQLGEKTQRLIG